MFVQNRGATYIDKTIALKAACVLQDIAIKDIHGNTGQYSQHEVGVTATRNISISDPCHFPLRYLTFPLGNFNSCIV